MPWLAATNAAGTDSTVSKLFWWRPDASASTDFHEVDLPSNVSGIAQRASWALGPQHKYGVGAWSSNMIFTNDFQFWSLGIRAPTSVPTVALAAGPGITGEMICYWAWYDERTGEWSPLSEGSTTLTAANQSIAWSSFPVPTNPRVTHIGLWRSVDGSLPRLVMLRQVGITSTADAVAVGDLGEAFVDDFDLFDRGRYCAEWHERLVIAGNDDDPTAIQFSLINDREKREFSLKTKSGQPVVGIVNVKGTLVILCPRASEIVTGWTVDDIAIEIAQPNVGCISHHGIAVIHGFAWIPTHLGLYICDGAGWFFVGDDVSTVWIREYEANRANYENSWAVHDPVSQVYKLYVGNHTDTNNLKTYWVADYTDVTPQTGGGMGQPKWSYDVSGRTYDCAGLLAVPGGRRADVYTGTCEGLILLENNSTESSDQGDIFAKRMTIRWGAHSYGDEGGDFAQAKRFTDIDLFVKAEDNAWTLNVYTGDVYCYPAVTPSYTKSPAASEIVGGGVRRQPKTEHHFQMPKAVGMRAMVEVVASAPVGMEVFGYQINWKEGPRSRRAAAIQGGG